MIKKLLPKSNYAKNILTLMSGTGLAQAIPIAISPILTRIYSPEEFGIFAMYLAITAILSVLITGRYELAIMLPKKDEDAANILGLSVFLSFFVSLLLLVMVFIFGKQISELINMPEIKPWLYWIPASTLLTGIYQSLNYWSNRRAHYSRLAISRVFQSGGTAGGQLGAAIKTSTSAGLIGGQIFGLLTSTVVLAKLIATDDKKLIRKINKEDALEQCKRYINFPRYLIIAHVFNTASSQMAVMLLNTLFSSVVGGLYMLTQRVLGAPVTLVASALGDVFRQEASHSFAHTGQCKEIYLSTFKNLLIIATPVFLVFYFIAPELFTIIFGEKWREAGEYAQILTPMFYLRFVTSPLSSMFMIAEKQRLDLLWQIFLFLTTTASLVIGYYFDEVKLALLVYMLSYVVMFSINGVMTYKMAKG